MTDTQIAIASLTSALKSYVVSPLNAFGMGGYVFDIMGEATTKLDSEVTDHYTEDNKAVQDHIARKPKIVTLRGYVGELVYENDGESTSQNILQSTTKKLSQITTFLPTISTMVTQGRNVIENKNLSFSEGVSSSADIYGIVKNIIGSTGDLANQQKAYRYFKACWEQGVLMAIQTPWEFMTNMVIMSVTAIQGEDSQEISDFAVTYKQMRFAQTKKVISSSSSQGVKDSDIGKLNTAPIIPVETKVLDGSASVQNVDPVSIGAVGGVGLPSTSLSGAQSRISTVVDLTDDSFMQGIFIDSDAPPVK